MGLQFGVFDHIEPIPGQDLGTIYKDRLTQLEMFDSHGFYGYHLAEHHSPAVHSLAPSQNVFRSAASQRTSQIKLAPCIYVLPLHHPLRLVEEICMLDHLSDGRLEVGVGRGGVLEAYFWGSDWGVEENYTKYQETLAVMREGLSHDSLTFKGEFYNFDNLPMRLRPKQQPYPPMWYMRNVETAANEGMNCIIVGNLDGLEANVKRYREIWAERHGPGSLTVKGTEPKIGLVNHLVLADTEEKAVEAARPAWEEYLWNLSAPRRIEAEQRGLTQFLAGGLNPRPEGLPDREAPERFQASHAADEAGQRRRQEPGNVTQQAQTSSFRVIAGTPDTIRAYLDEYLTTGANYFVCAFHFGNMASAIAEHSIELFVREVMPHYV